MLLLFNQFFVGEIVFEDVLVVVFVVIAHPPLGFHPHPIFSYHNKPLLADFGGVLNLMFTLWVLWFFFCIAGLATKGLFSLTRNC